MDSILTPLIFHQIKMGKIKADAIMIASIAIMIFDDFFSFIL